LQILVTGTLLPCNIPNKKINNYLSKLLSAVLTVPRTSAQKFNQLINKSHVAQSCYSVIGDKPFLWSKPKFDPP